MTGTTSPEQQEKTTVNTQPYLRFCNSQLILRDELAIDRTLLANERTLLAYLRSGVALMIAGLSIMQFAHSSWFWVVGVACIPAGIVTGIIGIKRHKIVYDALSSFRQRDTNTDL